MEKPYEKMYANLHFHTEYSDNMRSVREVIRLGVEEGFSAFGVTDHDTVRSWDELSEVCKEYGVDFLPGCEFYGLAFGKAVHITAFHFDPTNSEMVSLLSYVKNRNLYILKTRFDLAVERGTIQGITWEDVLKRNSGIDFLYHGHVVRTMIEKGLLTEEESKAFIRENFTKEKVPIPIPMLPPPVEDIISAIKSAGGIPIMAHPGYESRQELMEPLIKMGIRGIELWHPQNDAETREKVWDLAHRHQLYISGGTDHHGYMEGHPHFDPNAKENPPGALPPCMYGVTLDDFLKLKNRVYG